MARKQGKAPYIEEDVFNRTVRAIRGCNSARNKVILWMSYNMGLRAKELAALRIGDVFTPQSEIRDTVRLLRHMTKGARFREVYLVHEETRKALNDYLLTRGTRAPERPLFLSQKGDAFSANTMQRLMGLIYRTAQVPGSSHSGRRSFATRLNEKGADIYAIQRLMGHESITTTQEYLFASPERLKKASALLN